MSPPGISQPTAAVLLLLRLRGTTDADGEKQIDIGEFRAKAEGVLREPRYRQSAKRVCESNRRFGGIGEAAEMIERVSSGARRA